MCVAPPQNFLLQLLHCNWGEVPWSASTVTESQRMPSRLGGATGALRTREGPAVLRDCSRPRRLSNWCVCVLYSMVCDAMRESVGSWKCPCAKYKVESSYKCRIL